MSSHFLDDQHLVEQGTSLHARMGSTFCNVSGSGIVTYLFFYRPTLAATQFLSDSIYLAMLQLLALRQDARDWRARAFVVSTRLLSGYPGGAPPSPPSACGQVAPTSLSQLRGTILQERRLCVGGGNPQDLRALHPAARAQQSDHRYERARFRDQRCKFFRGYSQIPSCVWSRLVSVRLCYNRTFGPDTWCGLAPQFDAYACGRGCSGIAVLRW